jgi:hypothetical protein
MNVYIPKDIMKFLDENKGEFSRETLIIKILGHAMDGGVDLNKVKQRGGNNVKNGAQMYPKNTG